MKQESEKPDTSSRNVEEPSAEAGSNPSLLPVIKEEKEEKKVEEKDEKKVSFELPLGYLLASELQEMYDEDRVTHRQGSSEPEAD